MPGTGGARPLGSLAGPARTGPAPAEAAAARCPQHCPLPSRLLAAPALPCLPSCSAGHGAAAQCRQ